MKYIRRIIFIIILLILFIPNINAEDLSLYELKIYEIDTSSEPNPTDLEAMSYITNKLNTVYYPDDSADYYDNENNLIFSYQISYDEDYNETSSYVISDNLLYPYLDFVFDDIEKEYIQQNESLLKNYDGVRLGLKKDPDKKECDSVCISSLKFKGKSKNTVIKGEPSYEGLKLDLGVSFSSLNDFVSYELELDNPTDIEYEVSTGEHFSSSDYIKYEYSFMDDSNILSPHDSRKMQVTVRYDKEVPLELTINGYNEQKEATLHLVNEEENAPSAPIVTPTPTIDIKPVDEEIKVPDTYIGTSLLIIFAVIAILGYISYNKLSGKYFLLFIPLLLIPVVINAAEPLTLKISVDVSIKKQQYEVAYYTGPFDYIFRKGVNSYQTIDDSACSTLYVGEEEYDLCSRVIIIDDKYFEGEKVELKSFEVKRIRDRDLRNCSHDAIANVYNCDEGTTLLNDELYLWQYMEGQSRLPDYPRLTTDPEKMNFIDNDGEVDVYNDGSLSKYDGAFFTMPNHNVLFDANTVR